MGSLRNFFVVINLFISFIIFHSLFAIRVDTSCKICQQENDYITQREENIIKPAIKRILGNDIKLTDNAKLPKVGFCFSGGGYRSMISSLGFMQGAQEAGILDLSSYFASLSGSTWMMAPLLLRSLFDSNLKLADFRQKLKERVVDLDFKKFSVSSIDAIINRLDFKDKITGKIDPVDLWGGIFADRLLGDLGIDNAQKYSFLQIRRFLGQSKNYPYPLFTAVVPDVRPYEWFEVGPYSSGCEYVGGYVETKYFGSLYSGGTLYQKLPEKDLGEYMGIFGSAYCFSCTEVFTFMKETFAKVIKKILKRSKNRSFSLQGLLEKFVSERLFPSYFNNYTYAMLAKPFSSKESFKLVDAGMDYNLPFPPLFKRNVDVIVVCDASGNVLDLGYGELEKAAKYAQRKSIKFPDLKNGKEIEKHIYFFEGKDKDTPSIIYLENPDSYSTLKFNYSEREFNSLCDSMKNLVEKSKQTIFYAIKQKLAVLNK